MAKVPVPPFSMLRIRGDGMDSDNHPLSTMNAKTIKPTPRSVSPPNPPPVRHKNLNASIKAATIAKTQKPRHVPKEPTKGAVGQMNGVPLTYSSVKLVNANALHRTNEKSKAFIEPSTSTNAAENIYNSKRRISENSIQSKSQVTVCNNKFNKHNTYSGSLSNSNNNPLVKIKQNAPEKVSLNTDKIVFSIPPAETQTDSLSKTNLDNFNANSQFEQNSVKRSSTLPVNFDRELVKAKNDHAQGTADFVINMNTSIPPEEEREVEGQSLPVEDVSKLQSEITNKSQQLQQQIKINADLKKLLVAAVGDDLHWKMDALVNTKTQLADEIGGYTEKIENDYEELDRLSIHADVWRSKFMATRVLIDQLASEKERSVSRWRSAERALQHMMQERQQLHEGMVDTHRYLKLLRDSFDPVFARRSESLIPNILELARTNQLLAESVKVKLLGQLPVLAVALDAGIQNGLTPAEKTAYQVLMEDWSEDGGGVGKGGPAPGRLAPDTLHHFGRFHPRVRYEGITCSSCRNCRGEIQVI